MAVRKITHRKGAVKRKTPVKRRRRVSGIGKMDLGSIAMDVAGLVGGAIIAREASTIILKQMPDTSHLLIGLGQVAAGVLLPRFMKSKLGNDLGNGMVAFGGQVLAVEAGLISGIGAAPTDTMTYRISGGSNLKINGGSQLRINGVNDMSMNGVNDLKAPKRVIKGL
jgi:hypothetical protein